MNRRQFVRYSAATLPFGVAGCTGDGSGGTATPAGTSTSSRSTPSETPSPTATTTDPLSLTSPAFADGATIPTRFTCAGENVSPRLDVRGVPEDATSLALVVDDPDAPTDEPFVHWLLWNVPADRRTIPEGVPQGDVVDALDGARQGENSAGEVGYVGPCPPTEDGAHTYRFDLAALDTTLDVEAGATRSTLESAMAGHVLAETRLIGEFDRN
ncbi:MAG: YbhB/YbcL family Raf kinase inhibitor-like protein [Haloferacaceae archaeon]